MLVPILLYAILFPDSTIAQQVDAPTSWTAFLVSIGGTGLLLYLTVLTGKLRRDSEVKELLAEKDRQIERCEKKLAEVEAELRQRNKEAYELMPTLTKTALLVSRFVDRQDNTPPPKGRG